MLLLAAVQATEAAARQWWLMVVVDGVRSGVLLSTVILTTKQAVSTVSATQSL